MKTLAMPSGAKLPVFGLGTWHMGERKSQRKSEADALRHGLDLGVRLLDTAEMYGEGGAEEVVAEALRGRRDDAFIVSKVYPHNASRKGVQDACERSLRRLQRDRIDLYLLHWRGSVPLEETFEAFVTLRDAGKIGDFGVSNFDHDDLRQAAAIDGGLTASNQILYNLARREAEWAVLPWCRQHGIPVMAYCPLDQGGSLLQQPALVAVAERHQATAAQVALRWLLQQEGVTVIPKSSNPQRIAENYAALELNLDSDDLAELDSAFASPTQPAHLGMV